MKKERLFVVAYPRATLVAMMAIAGEEKGYKEIDKAATSHAATVMGLYAIANPDLIVKFDAIEYEEPCEEHPEDVWVYVHLNIEE